MMPASRWLRSLTSRMVLTSAVVALALAVVFSVLLTNLSSLSGTSRQVRESMDLLELSSRTQNSASDVLAAARDYADNGQESSFQRWQALRTRVIVNARDFGQATAGHREAARTTASIQASVHSVLNDWSTRIVTLERQGHSAEARRIGASVALRQRITALRASFEAFNQHEKALGDHRAATAHEGAFESSNLLKASFLGLLVLIVALAWLLAREIVAPVRRMALAARRMEQGDLSARVPEGGDGEVGELAQAFNRMARSVLESRGDLVEQNAELEAQQVAIERALTGIAEQKNRAEGLHRFGDELARETDLDVLAKIVLGELRAFLGAEVGTLYSIDEEHLMEMTRLAAVGLDLDLLPESILPGEGLAGRAIVERRMITASFGDDGLRMGQGDEELLLAREIHVPLVQGDQPVGVVTLGTTRRDRLRQQTVEQLAYLAGQAAVALSNAIALRRARRQAAINRAVLENAREAFIAFEESGKITSWNPQAEKTFGYSTHEALGRDVFETVLPEWDRDHHRERFSRLLSGELSLEDRHEMTFVRRDRSEFPGAVTVSTLDLGSRRAINVFLHDVTDAKRAELYARVQYDVSSVLAESGDFELAAPRLLAAIGGGLGWPLGALWTVADDGSTLERQTSWADVEIDGQIAGLSGEPLARQAWQGGELVMNGDADAAEERQAAHDAGLAHAVALPLTAEGGVMGAMTFYVPTAPDPEDRGLTSALSAISLQVGQYLARKRAQRAAERMKDGFLALVSHELRTPLTSIVGYLELLVEDESEAMSDHGRQFMAVIDRNARRLHRLVDDVLFAAQAEAGRLSLDPGRVDLAEVAAESVEAARPKAVERTIELRLDAGRLPYVWADRDRMGQAIDNLISNALKFTPPCGRVEVRLRRVGELAAIEVSDTGLGMSEQDRERVFDRFFRAGATRDSAPGVGLGLTIVKAIAEAHGGRVNVESQEGAGTSFLIELPIQPQGEPARDAEATRSLSRR